MEVAFQLLPPADIIASVKMVHDEPGQVPSKKLVKNLTPHLNPIPIPKQQTLIVKKEI